MRLSHFLCIAFGTLLLSACVRPSQMVNLTEQAQCPVTLNKGQQLILSLPSNPSTGFRWMLHDVPASVLEKLGPEVYSNPQSDAPIGSAGLSTWRFRAGRPGTSQLRLDYQRPWEQQAAPENVFDCTITVK